MLTTDEWNRLREYVLARQEDALDRLGHLIRIPTVAHPSQPNPALFECAELLAEWISNLGTPDARIVTPAVNPLVTGSLDVPRYLTCHWQIR
jgi:acetylornithine deacetylase/succinyl-diaminopimelate desuccinylase-like protein